MISPCALLPWVSNGFKTLWNIISPHKQKSTDPDIMDTRKLVAIPPTRVFQSTHMTWAHKSPSENSIEMIGVEEHQLWDTILPYATSLSIRGWGIPKSSSIVIFQCFWNSTGRYASTIMEWLLMIFDDVEPYFTLLLRLLTERICVGNIASVL